MLPLELLLPAPLVLGEDEDEDEPGVVPEAPLLLPPMLPAPPVLPLPLSEEPELPLEDGAAPEGEGEELEGVELEGEDGVAEGEDEDEAAPGAPPPEEEDDDEVSPPAEGVLGVLGAGALLLGAAGAVDAEPLEDEPGAAPEVPEPPPESLLQPASKAARMLAASRTFEGWVSFIVGFL